MGMPVRRESLITLPNVWFSEMTCKDGEKKPTSSRRMELLPAPVTRQGFAIQTNS
jgi:hypothetical protein